LADAAGAATVDATDSFIMHHLSQKYYKAARHEGCWTKYWQINQQIGTAHCQHGSNRFD